MKKVIGLFREYVTTPILVVWCVAGYLVREVIFGSRVAINSLRATSRPAIVPILRLRGAVIGANTVIGEGVVFENCSSFQRLKIGQNCAIGKNCFFDLRGDVTIEANVVVSMGCSFITHIDMSNSRLSAAYPADLSAITIQADAYIGANTTVLMGVSIGTSTLVGANSLVKGTLEPLSVYAGSPAKKVRSIDGD